MLGENLNAAEAGYRVGYDDASHFSREYKRHFGEPPMRDVEALRGAAARREPVRAEVPLDSEPRQRRATDGTGLQR
jgi:AraC-like DNA-binding protein